MLIGVVNRLSEIIFEVRYNWNLPAYYLPKRISFVIYYIFSWPVFLFYRREFHDSLLLCPGFCGPASHFPWDVSWSICQVQPRGGTQPPSLISPSKQCCGSAIFIPDPRSWFYPSRIPDPGSWIPDPGSKTATKERGEKKFVVLPSLKFFIFDMLKKKNLAQFSKNYWSFYPKNFHLALKSMGLGAGIRDPVSGKNLFRIPDLGCLSRIPDPDFYQSRIPDPGVKKAPDPGSVSATLHLSKVA